jgi:hypothetical protein
MKLAELKNTPFRMQDLSSVYPDCVNLAMKAKRLENVQAIIRLKKGLYVVTSDESGVELSQFLLANHIYGPSYVSMQAALRYYGLIPEAVYNITSMTTGVAKSYENSVGAFRYIHVLADYYQIGSVIGQDGGSSFLMATPEKALCDLMVYTPNLNLRFKKEIRDYLEYDIRFDMDALADLNVNIIRQCAEVSRKKTMLTQLVNLVENERNI